jgi:hypothetical protein
LFTFGMAWTVRRTSVLELLSLLVCEYSRQTLVDFGLQSGNLARLLLVQTQYFGNRFGQYLPRLRRRAMMAGWMFSLAPPMRRMAAWPALFDWLIALRGRTATLRPTSASQILHCGRELCLCNAAVVVGIRLLEDLENQFRRRAFRRHPSASGLGQQEAGPHDHR